MSSDRLAMPGHEYSDYASCLSGRKRWSDPDEPTTPEWPGRDDAIDTVRAALGRTDERDEEALDALFAAGFAIVRLPEPTESTDLGRPTWVNPDDGTSVACWYDDTITDLDVHGKARGWIPAAEAERDALRMLAAVRHARRHLVRGGGS